MASLQRPGLYWHMLPTYQQGRKIVWDGYTGDGTPFLAAWPEELIANLNNTEMKIELETGSTWQVVGTDNVDRLVGANPVGCVLSEYSLQDPRAWNYVRPILAENGGWALFIYTPRGRNHGYDLLEMARGNPDWFAQVLTRDDTHAIGEDAVEAERAAGMPEEMVQQEFYCSFDAALVGAYYSEHLSRAYEEERIVDFPYEEDLPVHTAWDLGMHDATAIWFWQEVGDEYRFLDYYEGQGMGLREYIQILQSRGYVYGDHYGPWDLAVRELGTGKSRQEVALSLGLRFRIAPKLPVQEGIDTIRRMFTKFYFHRKNTLRGVEALKQYRKEFDHKRGEYSAKPVHDWTSHAADALRTFAIGRRRPVRQESLQQFAIADYDELGYGEVTVQ